ncbi:MAG: tetratricopeptide repeat protein [Chthoniobacterales bacterium]|nr:tetratricopeptide repeat protein [Chthoniobacterales bacterium]
METRTSPWPSAIIGSTATTRRRSRSWRSQAPPCLTILKFSIFPATSYRRQGHWRQALAAFARARELDPRQAHIDGQPETLRLLRQWTAASDAYREATQIEPQLFNGWVGLAYVQFAQSGDPSVARTMLERLPEARKSKGNAPVAIWDYRMLARDFAAAERAVPNRPLDEFPASEPKSFYEASIAIARGDREQARALLQEITPLHQKGVRDHPDDPTFHAALGKVFAMFGRKEEAIREAKRAVELCPEEEDAVGGPIYEANLAFVFGQTGEVEQAVNLLSRLLTTPAAERITLAHLRLSWEWDPLRGDPRFQALVKGPEPATIYR